MTQPETVDGLLDEFAGADAEDILAATARRFPGRVAFATSLGLEDQVLTAMIAAAKLDIPVFTLDTGRLYPESYDLIARTSARYGIPIRVYFPAAADVEELVNGDGGDTVPGSGSGVNLFLDSIEARKHCCDVRKVRPLRRAQAELDAWVCGLRSGQGATRQAVAPAEWDDGAGIVKINPLAAWDEARVLAYIKAHDVPYNPLHDAGFPSIGCAPCTRAVPEGEDARSGRWWWESAEHRECGLHLRSGAAAPAASANAQTAAPASPDGAAS